LVRVGGRAAALLRVRVPGKNVDLVVTPDGVGIVDPQARARMREALAGGVHDAAARARLEGGRVVGVSDEGVGIEREGAHAAIVRRGASVVIEANVTPVEPLTEEWRAELEARAASLVDAFVRDAGDARKRALARALAKAGARIERRIEAVRGDLARASEADALAERARLFVAEAAHAPRGARSLTAIDWSTGEPRTIELALDPARTARDQIEAMFKRARRLHEGARISSARLVDQESARAALASIARDLDSPSPDLDALAARARAAAPRDFALAREEPTPKTSKHRDAAPVYRTFRGSLGARILVGRGAARNDELTLHVARPHDLFLHVKGRPGAHVIVPLAKGASCPADLLVEAAHLAAHFSDARDEPLVDVTYAPRRYVRKPRGSAPGLVVVDREKVLALRREPPTLARLLATEEP
jgi:predicted ribosome quality control (RQC) complex YloA/Tae2 family protein